jgi:tRNA(fMet)-specific endonuclease VapC
MIILDTDHLTLLQWGGEAAEHIEARLSAEGHGEHFPTTIISCAEQFQGWVARIARAKTMAEEVRLYDKLHSQLQLFRTLRIEKFSDRAAVEFQRLRGLKVRIGTMDLKIAAIALSLDATVYTRNYRDFSRVPGLKFMDATI